MPHRNFVVSLALLSVLWFGSVLQAGKGTELKPLLAKPGSSILEKSFSGKELGKGWVANKGNWEIKDGALVGREKKEDMHAAVLTLQQLDVREPSLDVEKTGYRFVMRGESLLLDDVKVWTVEPQNDRGRRAGC